MEGRDGWMDLHIIATEYQDQKKTLLLFDRFQQSSTLADLLSLVSSPSVY
jgi:hypothetical protein